MLRTGHPVEPEELMAYLDGELAPARASEAMAHIRGCGDCQRKAAELGAVSREMAEWGVEGAEFELREAGPLESSVVRTGPRRRWPIWVGAVAAMLVAGVVGVDWFSTPEKLQVSMKMNGIRAESSVEKPKARNPLVGSFMLLPPKSGEPLIARTAEIELVVSDFARARAGLDRIVVARSGFATEMSVSTLTDRTRSIDGKLSVPAAQLDATLKDLRQLGRVESESQNGTDVTAQTVDLEARLSNARNTERRLTQLLSDRSGGLKDVLAVELELGRVRGEIESMEAQRKSLATQVERSIITVHLSEEGRAQLGSDNIGLRLRNGFVDGFRAMRDSVIGAGVLIGSIGPTVLLWGAILFFPARYAWRRWRGRRA